MALIRNLLLLSLPLLAIAKHIPGQCRWDWIHTGHCKEEPTNRHWTGVSPKLLADFKLFAQYAAAAYAPINTNSSGDPLTCSKGYCPNVAKPEGNCPLVEAARAFSEVEFESTPKFDDHGFIAVDDANKVIVLAFRGSESKDNWKVNFKISRTPTGWCEEKCEVHHGYWSMWSQIRDSAIANVKKSREVPGRDDYRFVVTGHSLGAALATLAATDFRRNDTWFLENAELFTYGSPRVGEIGSVRYMSELSGKSYRITAMNDWVPRTPGGPLGGYLHTSPEYWISANPDDPRPEDVVVATGYYTKFGANGQSGWGVSSHRHYFGWMSGCGDRIHAANDEGIRRQNEKEEEERRRKEQKHQEGLKDQLRDNCRDAHGVWNVERHRCEGVSMETQTELEEENMEDCEEVHGTWNTTEKKCEDIPWRKRDIRGHRPKTDGEKKDDCDEENWWPSFFKNLVPYNFKDGKCYKTYDHDKHHGNATICVAWCNDTCTDWCKPKRMKRWPTVKLSHFLLE